MASSTGGNWRRLLWEILVLGLLIAAGWLAWNWQLGEHREALQEREEALQSEYLEKRRALEARLAAALGEEAEAVARTFAAAIKPQVAVQDWAAIDRAAIELLFLPKLSFVHVLDAGGDIYVSSDRKLLATGRVTGSEAAWATSAAETMRRAGPDGLVEVATPLDIEGVGSAILWLGYRSTETVAEDDEADAAATEAVAAE